MHFSKADEERLFKKYDPLIRSVTTKYFNKMRNVTWRIEYEDLYQCARMGFLRHIRDDTFRPMGDACAKTPYMEWQMSNYIYRQLKIDGGQLTNIDASDGTSVFGTYSFESEALSRIQVEKFVVELGAEIQAAVQRVMDGETWEELAEDGVFRDYNEARRIKHSLRRRYYDHMRATGQPLHRRRAGPHAQQLQYV